MERLKVNDFFCGAGGMALGFIQDGWEITGAWDFDKFAVKSYSHNIGDHVKESDISEMNWNDIPVASCWTFGFPCQDLTISGNQDGMKLKCKECECEFEVLEEESVSCPQCKSENVKANNRSGLFFEIMRLLDETAENNKEMLPDVIMAENVKGLKPYLGVLEKEYEKRGYKTYYTIYDSEYWGIAQHRERYFVIGVHESIEKEFIFPVQQEMYIPKLASFIDQEVDEKYYIDGERAEKIIKQALEKVQKLDGVIIDPAFEKKEGKYRIYPKTSPTLNARDYKGPRMVVVANMQKNAAVMVDLCPTLTTSQGGYRQPMFFDFNSPDYLVRKLTPREYFRLQGFPEDYEIVVSDTQAYKQAGNAVSVPIARALAERIKMFLLSL